MISMLVGIALLPVSVQASDFDDITLQIMDADSTGENANQVGFSQPELDMHDVVLMSKNPQGPSSDPTASTAFGDPDTSDVDLPGEDPGFLPPDIDGPTVDIDPGDFPEDLGEDLDDLVPIETDGPGGIGGDLPGEVPDNLPPEVEGPDVDPDDLPEGTVTY